MSYATADLSDARPEIQICEPIFADYGGVLAFHGPIVTLKVFEDNGLVRSTLETRGERRVLVVDGGGSLRCALVGGTSAHLESRTAGSASSSTAASAITKSSRRRRSASRHWGPIRARAKKACTAVMSTKWSALPALRSGPGSGCTRMPMGLSCLTSWCTSNCRITTAVPTAAVPRP